MTSLSYDDKNATFSKNSKTSQKEKTGVQLFSTAIESSKKFNFSNHPNPRNSPPSRGQKMAAFPESAGLAR